MTHSRLRRSLNALANLGLAAALLIALVPVGMSLYGSWTQAQERREFEALVREAETPSAAPARMLAAAPRKADSHSAPTRPAPARKPPVQKPRPAVARPALKVARAARALAPAKPPAPPPARRPVAKSATPAARPQTDLVKPPALAPRPATAAIRGLPRPAGPNPAPAVHRRTARKRASGRTPLAELRIPSIGVNSIVVLGTGNWRTITGPGLLPHSALPGSPGNCVVAAHRNMWDRTFARLPRVKRGDKVYVRTPKALYTYVVDWSQVVSTSNLAPIRRTRDARITLYTCVLPFNAHRRWVVQGRLVASSGGPQAGPRQVAGAGASRTAVSSAAGRQNL